MNDTTTTSPVLTIRRTFKAPRARVFDAFTDAAVMRRWMGGPESTVRECAFDAREGGSYRVVYRHPEHGDFIAKGTITALRRPDHLAYTWRWEEDDVADEHETFVRIDFIDRGSETDMIFTQENLASEESRARHEHGWSVAFARIDGVLAP